jgi:excisionase family DNA binding protein
MGWGGKFVPRPPFWRNYGTIRHIGTQLGAIMSSNIRVQRVCSQCGKEFTARTTTTQYCGDTCAKRAYKARIRAGKIEQSDKDTQRIKAQPIEELKAKAFLSIAETCKLVGISRRTVCRMIQRGELATGKAGRRTIIRRSDLEQVLFGQPRTIAPPPERQPEQKQVGIADCYTLTEVQSKYGISGAALQNLIKRNSIPKIKKGWFAYVPKTVIDKLLS